MQSKSELLQVVKDHIHFDSLWAQAKQWVEKFGGQLWTDTADHDPGVTFLQGYSYSASDLAYRYTLPLVDLLTPPPAEQTENDGVFPENFGPHQTLTCGPITCEDYRRALLDLTDKDETYFLFRNAQLVALDSKNVEAASARDYIYYFSPTTREFSFVRSDADKSSREYWLRGNYALHVEPTPEASKDGEGARAQLEVFFKDHRNLCEAISRVVWATPQLLNPLAEIQLHEGVQDYAAVYADLYMAALAYVSPSVLRESAAQLEARQTSTIDIYDGPLLRHGWQMTLPPLTDYTKQVEINTSGIASAWMAVAGVKSVVYCRESTLADGKWHWKSSEAGTYAELFGADPLGKMIQSVKLTTADGIYVTAAKPAIQARLTATAVQHNPSHILRYGKSRNLSQYHPVTDKIPSCYGLRMPVDAGGPKPLYQFLLPFEQMMSDACRELSTLPKLLSFVREGNTAWESQWPYAEGTPADAAHASYKRNLLAVNESSNEDSARELGILDHLLGYFGTRMASKMLDTSADEFRAVEQRFLSQITMLAYQRANIRVDQVSALQKRIAARMGWGQSLFDEHVDMSVLPFYLVEHRALLPKRPSSRYDTANKPADLSISLDGLTLKVTCVKELALSELISGQLIDLIAMRSGGEFSLKGLIVDAVDAPGQSFTLDLDANPLLQNSISVVLDAQDRKELSWRNSESWLREIAFPLIYEDGTPDAPAEDVVLMIGRDDPFPAHVRVDDALSVNALSMPNVETWSMEVLVKTVDSVNRKIVVNPAKGTKARLPSPSSQKNYVWHSLGKADRFSLVVSLVMNRAILPKSADAPTTEAWIKRCVQAELPAHIRLLVHWLEPGDDCKESFSSFARSYAAWQNARTAPSTATYVLLRKLGLGTTPAGKSSGIGVATIAKADQRDAALGNDGRQWNIEVILKDGLFFVPRNGFKAWEKIKEER
jgi:hypothetical protein